MSLLTIAKNVSFDVGIDAPTTIINNDDDDARRLLRHIKATGTMLMREYPWQALRREATFNTVASENQGSIADLVADNDVDRIIPNTLYNRATQREAYGQTSAMDYAFDKARQFQMIYDQFVIRGGNLLLNPVPAAGNTFAFEYVSNAWIYSGSTRKKDFTADSDEIYLDEELVTMGAVARFKKSIGADWQADEVQFMRELEKRKGADTPQGRIQMAEASDDVNAFGFFVERTA